MREILYKAKRLDNKEWVYGYLMDENYINIPFNDDEVGGRFDEPIEVDPETVCQYTSVDDKNETKIFEGDICEREVSGGVITGLVVWLDIGVCGFYLNHKNHYYPIGKDEHTGKSNDEIIGNIYDNQEENA